jgi:putative membrane protein
LPLPRWSSPRSSSSTRDLPRPEPVPRFAYSLPKLNAVINGTCSVLLLTSFYFIRRKRVAVHKALNITSFVLSAVFLVSYATFHWLVSETRFPADNPLRPVYLFILVSHIVLAAAVLPLVLIAFYRGLTMQTEKHKRIVRLSFPIWLYVTITGVIVYLMISPHYDF